MELAKLMKDAGIIGAGGAGFPSYAKLAEGADTLLVNGSECEPLLYTDFYILKNETSLVLEGVKSVMRALGIRKSLLCIKEHTAERLTLSEGESLAEGIFVKVLPNVYPIGDEISLIYQSLGRVVKPGSLPITEGVIVYNVETMYNLGSYVTSGKAVTDKWLTVGGDIKNPTVLKVPVGTRVSDLLSRLGITVPDTHAVIDGGPSMGKIILPSTAIVGKTTKSILILPKGIRAVESKFINVNMAVARASTACCQCTRCSDMCPRGLLGYPLEPHKMVRTAMNAAEVSPKFVLAATLCCGCGVCENLACSQGISPKAVIANYKALLAKNKLRYSTNEPVYATAEREYRMIPSERWEQTLGVARYNRLPGYIEKREEFDRVEIPLNRHIGAPSVPAVKDGDIVAKGDMIADAAGGLSVPQHASIGGRVRVADNKIMIDRI